jgi:hypothetical protein
MAGAGSMAVQLVPVVNPVSPIDSLPSNFRAPMRRLKAEYEEAGNRLARDIDVNEYLRLAQQQGETQ